MTDEPIEPDEIIPATQDLASLWFAKPSAGPDADQSWITDLGFEITRPSPPVGSVAAGFPGIGFDLLVPDESGRLQLAEAYGPDGAPVAVSTLSGRKVPQALSEAVPVDGRGHDDTSETGHPLTDPPAEGCPGCDGQTSPLILRCTMCGRE